MERIDRGTLIFLALALSVGFALWQLLSSLGYIAAELLIDLWGEGEEAFIAQFSIGGADIQYGQTLAALITLALVVLVTVPILRRAPRRRTDGSPEG